MITLVVSAVAASYLRYWHLVATGTAASWAGSEWYVRVSAYAIVLSVLAIVHEGLYDLDRLFWGTGEFTRIARALAIAVVAIVLATFAFSLPGLSRVWTLLFYAIALTLVSVERLLLRHALRTLRRGGKYVLRTLVVGSNPEATEVVRILKARPETGLVPVGCLATALADLTDQNCGPGDVPYLGYSRDLCTIVDKYMIDTVIIASTAFDYPIVPRMIAELRGRDVSIHLSSGLFDILTTRVLVREVAGVPLITVKSVSFSKWNFAVKRTFDLILASLITIVGSPLWVPLSLIIKLDSRGPVFYRQTRVGQNGELFAMYKFRSMCADADDQLEELWEKNEADGPLFKMQKDPRVTRIGHWMRKYSIDEFPQLINVLKGQMSLVGPRPPLIAETEQYTNYHWRRMEVLPGMTGLWQVSGRSSLTFEEMVRLDLFYIENWGVAFDFALLARTVPAVLVGDGAW
ncbi:MAG: sugar transferase [Coriobacteriia bacterium]